MQGLSFAHPWLLAGLAAAALPALIHLIGRRRAPVIAFGAFDFLLAANRRLARRERLRQIVLLVIRTLALVAVALALARPEPKHAAAAVDAQRRVAIVVDASGSMSYELARGTLLDEAKRRARELLTRLQPGDAATLVVAGAQVRQPLTAPTVDLDAVRRAIDEVGAPAGVADMGAAIDAALVQLGAEGSGAVLVLIGDGSRNSYAHLAPAKVAELPRLEVIDAARRDEPIALANAAVTRVAVQASGAVASERTITVDVRNYGIEPLVRVPLQLRVEGQVTQRVSVDIEAGASVTKALTTTFAATGVFRCDVTLLDPGGYHADDVAHFLVSVEPGVRLLLVNGDPSATPYDDELFFAQRALEVVPPGAPAIQVRVLAATQLRAAKFADVLRDTDAALLANVGELEVREVEALQQFVRRGGGLLWTLGDRVRFERANDLLGDLLPYPLRDLHRAADPAAGTPALGMGEIDFSHPILAGLGAAAEESLRASRTEQYFNFDVGAGLKVRTLLRFDNGAPALVEATQGDGGRRLALATSIDVDMSDLALRTAFAPLLQRTVRYLARAVDEPTTTDARVGASLEVVLPTEVRELRLVAPSGEVLVPAHMLDGGRRAQFDAMGEAGIYQAEVARTGGWQARPELAVAVNPALDESDFAPISQDELGEALGRAPQERDLARWLAPLGGDDPLHRRGLASVLLAALVLLFIGESLLAMRG